MKLNHLDLQVSDVPRTVALFEDLLGLKLESNRGSSAIAILTDGSRTAGDGFTLVLQRKKNDSDTYPEGFHFGFLVPDVPTVERFHASARARGLEVSEIITNNRGVLVYWRLGDGLLVEVSWHRPRRA